MASRCAADDRARGGAPCCSLTDWSVARSQNTKAQNDAQRNYNNFPSHDAHPIRGTKPQTAADVAGLMPPSEPYISDGGAITASQIRALRGSRTLVLHAQFPSNHTFDTADTG
jgi:hypothetical protein